MVADSASGYKFAELFQTAFVCLYSSKESYAVFADKELDAILMAGWPHKIPPSFIDSTSCPIVNIHASLLPKYRGPEPVMQQLLHDETQGGVTLHRIDQNFDAGPICVQASFGIEPNDDNRTLFFKAARAGKRAVGAFWEKLQLHELSFSPQDESKARYYPRLNVMDFVIDEASSHAEVLRVSRAFRGQYPLVCNFQNQMFFLFEFKFHDRFDAAKRMLRLRNGYLELLKYAPVGIPARSTPRDCESSAARSKEGKCPNGAE